MLLTGQSLSEVDPIGLLDELDCFVDDIGFEFGVGLQQVYDASYCT